MIKQTAIDIEAVCAMVHKAYCDNRIKQNKEEYWTKGDYNLLDDAAKDIDRATVFAVLKAIKMDKQYCPKCKLWVGGEDVAMNFHNCGCRVVPAYSEAMRLQAENAKLREILAAAQPHMPGCWCDGMEKETCTRCRVDEALKGE